MLRIGRLCSAAGTGPDLYAQGSMENNLRRLSSGYTVTFVSDFPPTCSCALLSDPPLIKALVRDRLVGLPGSSLARWSDNSILLDIDILSSLRNPARTT